MTWIAEALATGPQGAVKIMVIHHEPVTEAEKVRLESEASAQYRRTYGHWCDPRPHATVKPGPGA